MRRRVRDSLFLFLILSLLNGCSLKRKYVGTDVHYIVYDTTQEDLLRARVRCDRLATVGDPSTATAPCKYDGKDVVFRNPVTAMERNNVQALLMQVADRRYELTKRHLIGGQNALSFTAEMTGITLSSVSAILGDVETKSILSTTSSLVQSLNTSVGKNFLASKTASALVNQMDALRAEVATDIARDSKKGGEVYGFEAALRDAIRYDEAGTVHNALLILDASSDKTKKDAEANLQKEKKKP